MPSPKQTRSRRVDAQRNRDAILEAGLRVLSGQPDASLADIARASGVTRTTIYAHFANREELLDALVQQSIGRAAATIVSSQPGVGSAQQALTSAVTASWREIAANAPVLDLASRVLGEAATAERHAPVADAVTAIVRRGQQDGSFRADLPEQWLVTTYFALVHAAGRQSANPDYDPDDLEAALVSTLLGAFTGGTPLVRTRRSSP
jgi:AcrR family transcriptional regulator